MKNVKILVLSLIALCAISSCKKDGPVGPSGADGRDGNANVISSGEITLYNWSTDYDDGTSFAFLHDVAWPGITQEIKNDGVLMMYCRTYSDTAWFALPYSESSLGNSISLNFIITEPGQVVIRYAGYDSNIGSPSLSSLTGLMTIRMVAISSSARKANPDLDIQDYNAVKDAFHLKE